MVNRGPKRGSKMPNIELIMRGELCNKETASIKRSVQFQESSDLLPIRRLSLRSRLPRNF